LTIEEKKIFAKKELELSMKLEMPTVDDTATA
jgi:hypothetical protein